MLCLGLILLSRYQMKKTASNAAFKFALRKAPVRGGGVAVSIKKWMWPWNLCRIELTYFKGTQVRNLSIIKTLIRLHEVTASIICLAGSLYIPILYSQQKKYEAKEEIYNVWKGAEFCLHSWRIIWLSLPRRHQGEQFSGVLLPLRIGFCVPEYCRHPAFSSSAV